jgi:hypothetical protein
MPYVRVRNVGREAVTPPVCRPRAQLTAAKDEQKGIAARSVVPSRAASSAVPRLSLALEFLSGGQRRWQLRAGSYVELAVGVAEVGFDRF